jgi:hypothetical protein
MNTLSAFSKGLTKVNGNKRFILFAWFVNIVFGLILAWPMLNQLDAYIAPTIQEENLLQRFDENWYGTFRIDLEKSEIARMLNPTMLGTAPFFSHLDGVLGGNAIRAVGGFLKEWITGFEFRPAFGLLMLLLLIYTLVSTFLAGGFISAYAQERSLTIKEFLAKASIYFGRFFRLFLILVILFYVVALLIDLLNRGIMGATATSPSEMTPFVFYMIRNVVVFFVLAILVTCIDYAKIRLVVDDRWSAIGAFGTGFKFTFTNFGKTFPLLLLLVLIGVVLMALYGVLENLLPQTGYWTIVLVFILQQLYMIGRICLKGLFYASQTVLFSGIAAEQHTAQAGAVSPATV